MPPQSTQTRRHQVILFGASNLTRSIAVCSRTARAIVGEPCDLALVLGHGRSYGIWSNLLGRGLPSILDSEVWSTLQPVGVENNQAPAGHNGATSVPPRRFALITDVGNDIAYGRSPEEIETWLDETIARLQKADFTIVITALPLESLHSMSRGAFEVIRRLFFPTNPLAYATAMSRVDDVDARMRNLAQRTGIRFVEHQGRWFGLDPIHIKRRDYPEAWAWFMSHWLDDDARESISGSLPGVKSISTWWSLRLATPAHRRVFGIEQRHTQPVRRWSDGTDVSLY